MNQIVAPNVSGYLTRPLRTEAEAKAEILRRHAAELNALIRQADVQGYARRLAGQMFGKRVSTIFDPRYSDNPWTAFWDDYKDGDFMARGTSEAQAVRHLIEDARHG